MKFPFKRSLYLITDAQITDFEIHIKKVEAALKNGVDILQYRSKSQSSLKLYDEAKVFKKICDKYQVPLIINDRIDIAQAVDAHGVHIGQSDLPLVAARKILGSNKLIGVTTKSLSAALHAQNNGADYIGVGALFPTSSKADAERISVDTLMDIRNHVSLPIIGIGGIKQENLNETILKNLNGVAVISSILGAEDVSKATSDFKDLLR